MKKGIKGGIGGLLGIAFLTLSLALLSRQELWGHGGGNPKASDYHIRKLAERLELTDAQIQEIRELRHALGTEKQRLREDIQNAFRHLDVLVAQEPMNEAEIYQQIDQISQLRSTALQNSVATFLRMLKLLTSDQRQQLKGLEGGIWQIVGGPHKGFSLLTPSGNLWRKTE